MARREFTSEPLQPLVGHSPIRFSCLLARLAPTLATRVVWLGTPGESGLLTGNHLAVGELTRHQNGGFMLRRMGIIL